MSRRIAAPRRLRRRLTAGFVVVAAVSSGLLAGGSYLWVRLARLRDSAARAVEQTELHLQVLEALPGTGTPDVETVRGVISTFGAASSTVAVVRDTQIPSLSLGVAQVPEGLARLVRSGFLGYERTTVGGVPYVVAGAAVPGRGIRFFSFFSERNLQHDLSVLGLVLLGGWLTVVAVAALVGLALARRTLAPVARASEAARSLAEGLLDTRLPPGGDDEFGAWAASFNEMAQALESKIADLSEARDRERRFTSDVSHELRTPLTALVGEASVLREHLERMPAEARRPAEMLVADVARLRRMVEDLMEISRFDAGREDMLREHVDLGAVVAATIRARGWSDRVELHLSPVALDSDRRRLERIVSNLVGNALEHGGRGVTVTVGRTGATAFVEVADRGPGIAPEHVGRLFDRFFKADPSRSTPGSGLGLGIAMENARLLGGDIRVWSEPGAGSTFTLALPVTEPLPAGEGGVSPRPDDVAHPTEKEV